MATVIQVKRGTASAWTSANTVLTAGEIGFESDTKKMKVGDGSTAWTSLSYTATDGDITAVVAGTGLSGGSTSGSATLAIDTSVVVDKTTAQTLTNKTLTSPVLTTPSISTMTTTGDILYASAANTPARLGIGSADQVLTVSSGIPSWATASSGGMTLLSTTTTNSGSTIRIQSIDQNYKQLYITIKDVRRASTGLLRLYANNTQSGGYFLQGGVAASTVYSSNSQLGINLAQETTTRWGSTGSQVTVIIDGYATSDYKTFIGYGQVTDGGGPQTQVAFWGGVYSPKTAFTELNLKFDTAGDFTNGTVEVYGVK